MDLEKFKCEVIDLGQAEKSEIRQKYIETFVDVKSPTYQEQITIMNRYIDGYCYQGYLWEYIVVAPLPA